MCNMEQEIAYADSMASAREDYYESMRADYYDDQAKYYGYVWCHACSSYFENSELLENPNDEAVLCRKCFKSNDPEIPPPVFFN